MNQTENTVEQTQDVSILALVGGSIGLLSPLAVLSSNLLFIPIFAMLLLLAAFVKMGLHRGATMIGTRFATVSCYITLFFGCMGWFSAQSYRNGEIESAKHFASQWFELMTTGRTLEALQLDKPALNRAKGVGILRRYTTEKEYIESYKAFQQNDAVQVILRDFQGANITFKRVSNITFSRRLISFFVVFELSTGEGVMRKSREFEIQISAAKEYSDTEPDRYEWTTRLINVL